MPALAQKKRILEFADGRTLVTARELRDRGFHPQALSRLVEDGALERVARGVYRVPGVPVTEHHFLVIAAAAVPRGVICLLSALTFHDLGTQVPSEIWMAIEGGTRPPTLEHPPGRIVHFGGVAFSEGIGSHQVEGRTVAVYNEAKTIADCFKYRNKIGIDVALEALREGWRMGRFTLDELDRYAAICRVERVLQPYVESLVA